LRENKEINKLFAEGKRKNREHFLAVRSMERDDFHERSPWMGWVGEK
jgi:RNase P protein component